MHENLAGKDEFSYLGIDVGGTDIKYGIVNSQSKLISSFKEPTQKDSEAIILSQLEDICRRMIKEYSIKAVGIGIPGNVSTKTGKVTFSVNLPFRNTDVGGYLTSALGISVKIAKDSNCAVIYEHLAGSGRGFDNILMITIGTGIGGGLVLNNKLYVGSKGDAGEIGHIITHAGGIECGCGQEGCFEKYASATALIAAAKNAGEKNPDSILAEGGKDDMGAKSVFRAINAGCPVAQTVLDSWIYELALGIKSLVRIFSPDAIILGGGVMHEADRIIPKLLEKCGDVNIVRSQAGNAAGIIGAAMLQYKEI